VHFIARGQLVASLRLSNRRGAIRLEDSSRAVMCICLHSFPRLRIEDRRGQRRCSSSLLRRGNAPGAFQRSLSHVSRMPRGGALDVEANNCVESSRVHLRENLLCQLYSITLPLILSPNSVSMIHFLYLTYSLLSLSLILSPVAANCAQQLTPTDSGTSCPGNKCWNACL
jgi:hypothetical protein